MKYILILVLSTLLFSQDMDKIDVIVKDIEDLREKHSQSLISLSSDKNMYENKFNKEVMKNKSLLLKISLLKIDLIKKDVLQEDLNHDVYEERIDDLEYIIEAKDKTINDFNNQINILKKYEKNMIVKSTLCVEENIFPTLIMKDTKVEEEITFSAAAFRLLDDSDIYDSINGNIVTKWKKKTSFTSNRKIKNWVKVTGYFVERKWKKSKKELWIQSTNVVKR